MENGFSPIFADIVLQPKSSEMNKVEKSESFASSFQRLRCVFIEYK